jgi:hypothetical protein
MSQSKRWARAKTGTFSELWGSERDSERADRKTRRHPIASDPRGSRARFQRQLQSGQKAGAHSQAEVHARGESTRLRAGLRSSVTLQSAAASGVHWGIEAELPELRGSAWQRLIGATKGLARRIARFCRSASQRLALRAAAGWAANRGLVLSRRDSRPEYQTPCSARTRVP